MPWAGTVSHAIVTDPTIHRPDIMQTKNDMYDVSLSSASSFAAAVPEPWRMDEVVRA
jgi:hypothetical protein